MYASKYAGDDGLRPRISKLRAARCALLVSMLAVSSWAVAAGGAYTLNKGDSIEPTPWTPDIVAAIDAYVPSPVFNSGHFYLDHFAAPTNADVVGGITAQMSNGDIVVAGLVPDFGGSRACNNGTVLCNIGLVRYNASGVPDVAACGSLRP